MHEPIQRYTPAQMPVIFAVWIIVLAALAGCVTNPEIPEQHRAIDVLDQTASDIERAALTIQDALALGTLTVDSEEYAQIYQGVTAARDMINAAASAQLAGDPAANGYAESALSIYRSIQPLLLRYMQ